MAWAPRREGWPGVRPQPQICPVLPAPSSLCLPSGRCSHFLQVHL